MNSAPLFEVVTSNHGTDLVFKPVVTLVVVLSSHHARGILHSINCCSNCTIFGRKAYWDCLGRLAYINLVHGIQGQLFTNHNSRSSPKWPQKALRQKVVSILSLAPIFGVAVNVDIYLTPRLM